MRKQLSMARFMLLLYAKLTQYPFISGKLNSTVLDNKIFFYLFQWHDISCNLLIIIVGVLIVKYRFSMLCIHKNMFNDNCHYSFTVNDNFYMTETKCHYVKTNM